MGARDTFAWMRAARAALHRGDIGRADLALCFELVVMVDSDTLYSPRTMRETALEVACGKDALRLNRRRLVSAGLVARGTGWQLQTPGGQDPTPKGQDPTPRQDLTPRQDPTPKEAGLLPPYNNYRSTSSSTSNDHQHHGDMDGAPVVEPQLTHLHPSHRPKTRDRHPIHGYDLGALDRTWRAERRKPWPWVRWAKVVLPYLTPEEQAELVAAAVSTPTPNLPFLVAVVTRLCSGKTKRQHHNTTKASKPGAVPVVIEGRSEDDDAFLRAIS